MQEELSRFVHGGRVGFWRSVGGWLRGNGWQRGSIIVRQVFPYRELPDGTKVANSEYVAAPFAVSTNLVTGIFHLREADNAEK